MNEFHEYPKEWTERGRSFAARVKGDIGVHPEVSVSAHVCSRGGWRKGYRPTGNMCVKVHWPTGTDPKFKNGRAVYYGPESLESVRQWWDRKSGDYKTEQAYVRLLWLYRKSGIIPKHVARKHRRRIDGMTPERGNWRRDGDAVGACLTIAAKYVSRFGKCPKCGKREGFTEELLGFCCKGCRATWVDVDPYNCHWMEEVTMKGGKIDKVS